MSDQRHDIASSDDAIKWWKQSSSNDENQNGKNIPKLNRKVPLTAGAAISLSILCIVLMLPGAELTIPSQKEKSHSMMLSLNTNQFNESTQQDPPCSGYFVFVVDNSINTTSNYDKIVQSLAYITNNWKLDGSGKLQMSAAAAAGDFTNAMPFTKNLTEWIDGLQNLIPMMPSSDPPSTPIELADGISSEYCNPDSEFKIAQGGSVKFIIFTSVRNETEINNALNAQNPWLNCTQAGKEYVFMVAVDGGSTYLNQLSIPASDLFIHMNDFNQNEVWELKQKIILNMCDCAKLPDGRFPPGCLLPGPPPTTPTPTVISQSTTATSSEVHSVPPCSGYFVFVLDYSINTASNYNKIVQSLAYITNNWKLDEKLQLTAASATDGSIDANDFAKNVTEWNTLQQTLIPMITSSDPPLTPIELAEGISSEYCDSDSDFKIAQRGSVKFIIFTSVSDETEINDALKAQNPWLKCALAGKESIFMVAVDGGSTNLKKLSIPASDLFMQMNDFNQNEVWELKQKIILNMCDCAKLPDGNFPPGCLLPSPPPTTPAPTVISQGTTTTSSEVHSLKPSTPSIIPTQETTTLTSISQSTTATSSEESSDKPPTPSGTSSSDSTPTPNTSTPPGNDHSTSYPSSYGIRNTLALPVHYVVIITLVIMNVMSY